MNSKPKIVDLVIGEDGTYSERGTSHSEKKYPKSEIGSKSRANKFKNSTNVLPANMDEFFDGLDSGLDFVENVRSRVNRFMDLRD